MKLSGQAQKWAGIGLGVVCLALIINLISQFHHPRAATVLPPAQSRASTARDASGRSKNSAVDELARYDPVVHLDELAKLDDRDPPDLKRNPFEFVEPPPPPKSKEATADATKPSGPPPPPPPPPLKAMGYSENPSGTKEAYISDDQQNVFVVHEGESFSQKYKVLSISPTVVTIEDTAAHQTVQLPVPQ
ncbi:MAG: hypothetical protein LAP13_08900 [Acidobacteriia bacterium]|nr:hypothetical protein [Terriglobia bacterium]